MKVKLVRSALAVAFALFSFALDSFAWTVSGDYYVVGVPGGSLSSGTGYSGAPSTKYDVATAEKPNWSEIAADASVAAGSKNLRIDGCVILDQIPSGLFASYEIVEGSFLILNENSKSVFADKSKLVIPVGATAQLLPGTWTLDGGKYWLTAGAVADGKTVVGSTDLEINGTFLEAKVDGCWSDKNKLHNFNSKNSGTGTWSLSGWGKQLYLSQKFAFEGDLVLNGNYGGFLFLASTDVSGQLKSLQLVGNPYSQRDSNQYCAEGFVFGPPSGASADSVTLDVKALSGAAAEFSSGHRYGSELIVYGGRTVKAETFTGAMHVMADRLDQYNARDWIKNIVTYFGTGNLEVGEMAANAKLCISTNIFTTVGKMNAGAKIDYTCQSDGVNTMTLDVTGESDATATVSAPHLAMLPKRLSGFAGQVVLANTDEKAYAMTIDTSRGTAAGDYNAVGCVGSGTLAQAPAKGTLNVTLAGEPQDGEYALARFTAGGEKLAGWTVNVTNLGADGRYQGKAVRIQKDSTGLWLLVRTPVLPPISEDGWYLFGLTEEKGGALTTASDGYVFVKGDWPDWSQYDYPAGSKARFDGYVIIDEIPAGMFSQVEFVAGSTVVLRSAKAFSDGTALTIPEGVTVTFDDRFSRANVNDNGYWVPNTLSYIETFQGDLILNGTYRLGLHNDNEIRTVFAGDFSGTGSITNENWSEQMSFEGDEFGLTGSISFLPGYGSFVIIQSPTVTGALRANGAPSGYNSSAKDNYSYAGRGLVFGPRTQAEAATCDKELRIGTYAGYARFEGHRYGDEIIVYGGRRVSIGSLSGGFHAVATADDQYCSGRRGANTNKGLLKDRFSYFGTGEVAVDEMARYAYIYSSTKINLVIGTVGADVEFNYTCESGRINGSTLDVTNGCHASAVVKATDLSMLPSRISGFAGNVNLSDSDDKTYPVTIDLSKGVENGDYNVGGCIGSGRLASAPEKGTIDVMLAGEDLVPGDYAIASFTSGGTLISPWAVNLVNAPDGIYNPKGDMDLALRVRVVRGETGLWLRCRKVSGMTVIVR